MSGNDKNQVKRQTAAPLPDITSRPVSWRGWVNVALLFLTMETAVLSIEQARWITPQPRLTLVLFLSMVMAYLLVRSRVAAGVAYILALAVGGGITIWQAYQLSAPKTLAFAAFLVALTWIVGFVSTWSIVRRKNAWVAVCLGSAVILVNLSNLPDKYYFFFGLYFIAAVFLITHTRLIDKNYISAGSRGFTGRDWLHPVTWLVCIVVVATSVAGVVPEARAPQLRTALATTMPWKQAIEKSPLNFFATVPAKRPLNTDSTRRQVLFNEEWHHGERVDFIVKSLQPSYWRVNIYDIYTARGWENSPTSDYMLEQGETWGNAGAVAGHRAITYTVTTNINTDVVLMSGSLVSADMPVMVHASAGDVTSVMTPRVLSPAEQYTVNAATFSPSPADLSGTGGAYPPSIIEHYLRLPPDFPEAIRLLSENITTDAPTPYQKVIAINDYLSRLPYEEKIEAPAEDSDGVEHFLFTQKSGFCLYYASAAAVTLRSVGVPARLAIGYLPGDPGETVGEYILRDKHYHAWPQVYFPGYGWVDLEVTPSGTDSQVTINTPWISDSAIAQLPQWDIWEQGLAYGDEDWAYDSAPIERSARPTVKSGPLPFADELGMALLTIFALTAIIFILAAPFLALRSMFYRWLWQVDRANLAPVVYTRLCRLAAIAGRGPQPWQTPREFAARLTAEFPEQAKALDEMVRAYVENRFGRREGKPSLFKEAEILKARLNISNALLKKLNPVKKVFGRWR